MNNRHIETLKTACPQLKAMRRLERHTRARRLWVSSRIMSNGRVLVALEGAVISVHNDGSYHRTGA